MGFSEEFVLLRGSVNPAKKGSTKPHEISEGEPKEIGRELGVGSVLTGKIMQHGGHLR
jgi:TolB-like protein